MYNKCIRIHLILQDIQHQKKYQAATAPTQAQGRAQAVLGPAGPWAWAGPAAAWYLVFILYILDILDIFWIDLNIFWQFWYRVTVYLWYVLGIFS